MQAAYKNRAQAMELLLVYGRAGMEIETYREPRLNAMTIAVSLGHTASSELLALAERGELELSKEVARAADIDRKSLPADKRRVPPPGPQQRYQQHLLRQRERAPQPPPRTRGLCDTLPCSEDGWCEPELIGYAENNVRFTDFEAGAAAGAIDADAAAAAAKERIQTGAEVGELINRTPSGNDRRMVPQWVFFDDGSSPAADSYEGKLKSPRGSRASASMSPEERQEGRRSCVSKSPRGSGRRLSDQDAIERLLQRQNQTREELGKRMTDEWEKQLRHQYAGVDQVCLSSAHTVNAVIENRVSPRRLFDLRLIACLFLALCDRRLWINFQKSMHSSPITPTMNVSLCLVSERKRSKVTTRPHLCLFSFSCIDIVIRSTTFHQSDLDFPCDG